MHWMTEEAMRNAPPMMGTMMGPMGTMMGPMGGMMGGMGRMMGPMMYAGGGYVAARALGGSAVRRLLRSPLVLLAAGAALGYLAYRHRTEIIAAVAKASDAGKDFLLQQKESLADLVAEAREAEEREAKGGGEGDPPGSTLAG